MSLLRKQYSLGKRTAKKNWNHFATCVSLLLEFYDGTYRADELEQGR
jgi:hypothetical protein